VKSTIYMALIAALMLCMPTMAQEDGDSLKKVQADFQVASKDRKIDLEELGTLTKRLTAIADANPKSDAGFEALTWVGRVPSRARNGRVQLPEAKAIMDSTLKRQIFEYAATPHIEGLIMRLASVRSKKDAVMQGKRLDAICKVNTTPNVLALCLYARCMMARNLDRYDGPLKDNDVKAMYATAATLLKKYGKLKIPADRRGRTFTEAVSPLVFEFKNLRIGSAAPNITAKDLDGVEFSLSDYRGKVVVLDFWGDW